ncbi:alpha/beta fold hydrolase [Prauserella flavalba]|uniref:alpha/beta fold hydrolase n=1 Tax=Prauserella flavalba TaxID=1477506 RepID=UPI0036EB3DC3
MTTLETTGPAITEEAIPVWNGKLTIRVKIAGAGTPLLYLHPAAGLAWDPFLSRLAEHYTVYAPEFPGTSAGDPYAIHSVDHLSDIVLIYEELVRTLGLANPVVIGQSFGGMLAAELTSAFPELAAKVVLLDPIGLWRDDLPIANWIATPPDQLPALLFHDPAGPAAQSMLAMPDDPDIAAAATAALVWAFGSTGKFAWPIPDRGLRARLHRLTAPVLLVWGREDRLAPVGYVDEWRDALTDCRAVVINDCGHIPQVEKLQETLAAVSDFLGKDCS